MLLYLSMPESTEKNNKFDRIYQEYSNLMFYTANQLLGNTHDTEDVVHQSFLKITELLDTISTVRKQLFRT